MTNAPDVKPWGIVNKKKLQQLINDGKVDISRTDTINYIDSVFFKYYQERDNHVNFRRNFWNYAGFVDIEEHYQGYRARLAAGGIETLKHYLINYLLSMILGGRCFVFLFRQLTEQPHQGDMNNPTSMSRC
jgi:hypothetical protein